jgi:hypothetical protein
MPGRIYRLQPFGGSRRQGTVHGPGFTLCQNHNAVGLMEAKPRPRRLTAFAAEQHEIGGVRAGVGMAGQALARLEPPEMKTPPFDKNF